MCIHFTCLDMLCLVLDYKMGRTQSLPSKEFKQSSLTLYSHTLYIQSPYEIDSSFALFSGSSLPFLYNHHFLQFFHPFFRLLWSLLHWLFSSYLQILSLSLPPTAPRLIFAKYLLSICLLLHTAVFPHLIQKGCLAAFHKHLFCLYFSCSPQEPLPHPIMPISWQNHISCFREHGETSASGYFLTSSPPTPWAPCLLSFTSPSFLPPNSEPNVLIYSSWLPSQYS